ncbi:hypothetical protein BKA69DRAFT_1139368 [Paraphysoderma sedebokerense]|nr:hypothetical protein BKA69DRAFT_1139368 [Paraphysoderma sedebokerense]
MKSSPFLLILLAFQLHSIPSAEGGLKTKRGIDISTNSDHEIITPIRIHPLTRKPVSKLHTRQSISSQTNFPIHEQRVTFQFVAKDKNFTLDLNLNKDFISPNYQHITGDDEGQVKNVRDGIENCYYKGVVSEVFGSVVAISTCDGLVRAILITNCYSRGRNAEICHLLYNQNGVIHIENNERYAIHPLKTDDSGHSRKHIFIRAESTPTDIKLDNDADFCAVQQHFDSEISDTDSVYSHHPKLTSRIMKRSTGNKTIEIMIASDYERYQAWGSETEATAIELMNYVNLIFKNSGILQSPYTINIVLAGIYTATSPMWASGSTKNNTVDVDTVLNSFCDWRSKQRVSATTSFLTTNDAAHLLTGRMLSSPGIEAGSIEGYAFVGTMCSSMKSCGVERAGVTNFFPNQAVVIAHEIGHSLNAAHDGAGNNCPKNGFVMEAAACKDCGSIKSSWSDCSKSAINAFLPQATCLEDQTSLCGNGLLDAGEQCDSGSITGSSCCNADCTLKSTAQCDDKNGPCCQNCKFRSSTDVCRASATTGDFASCDIPDYCNGNSSSCPNQRSPNGNSCSVEYGSGNLDGVCSRGFCTNRASACQKLGYKYESRCDNRNDPCLLYCTDNTGSCVKFPYNTEPPMYVVAPDYVSCPLGLATGVCFEGRCRNSLELLSAGHRYYPFTLTSMILVILTPLFYLSF